MANIHNLTRERIEIANDRIKTRYDLRVNSASFKEGDLV